MHAHAHRNRGLPVLCALCVVWCDLCESRCGSETGRARERERERERAEKVSEKDSVVLYELCVVCGVCV